jgi:hemoglobin
MEIAMTESLYERLGGTEGITAIASDLIDIHLANPRIAPRYANSDIEKVKHGAATFFIAGTGGPSVHKDMLATHKGMNIDGAEFLAVLDDALAALQKNSIGQREQEEVLYIFYSMKSNIVLV